MKERVISEQQLIDIPPGKYMLADKNEFLRIRVAKTGLLVGEQSDDSPNYKLVLLDNKLILF
tara:strand:- start:724 stop:909 length:186 start_codon:yes stop_codon:yes gene_type:complete